MNRLSKAEALLIDQKRMLEDSSRHIEAMGLPLYLKQLKKIEKELRNEQTK